jgi:hypothetical protein
MKDFRNKSLPILHYLHRSRENTLPLQPHLQQLSVSRYRVLGQNSLHSWPAANKDSYHHLKHSTCSHWRTFYVIYTYITLRRVPARLEKQMQKIRTTQNFRSRDHSYMAYAGLTKTYAKWRHDWQWRPRITENACLRANLLDCFPLVISRRYWVRIATLKFCTDVLYFFYVTGFGGSDGRPLHIPTNIYSLHTVVLVDKDTCHRLTVTCSRV